MHVMSHLNTLESAGLIRLAQWEPELEYLFRHALVQDAAYASLLAPDRKRLHREVGQVVESLYDDRLDELAAVLARHFEQAGDDEQALHYFIRAAHAALASYANREAESQFRRALDLMCSCGERAELFAGLGEAVYRQSRFDEAIHTWHQGIELYRDEGDHEGIARLYARSARAAWHANDQPEGLRLCQEGLVATAAAPESPGKALLVHEAARAYHFNGLPDQALPLCRQALAMAERLGAIDVQADALTTLGVLPDLPPEEALAALRKAVELSESVGLLEIAVRANHNLGAMTSSLLGDLRVERDYARRAANLARQRGAAVEEALSLVNALGTSLFMGDLGDVYADLPRLDGLSASIPDSEGLEMELHTFRAALAWLQGEREEALEMLRVAQAQARERGNLQVLLSASNELVKVFLELDLEGALDDWSEVEAALAQMAELGGRGLGGRVWPSCQLIIVRARQGQTRVAEHLLRQVRDLAGLEPVIWDQVALKMAEAELAIAEERWKDALDATEAFAAIWDRMGRRLSWAQTLQRWAEIHVARGEPADIERAQALLREARTAFQKMGVAHYVGLVDQRMQELRARTFDQAIALGKAARELALAGRIQEGLLPKESPYLPGWQLAVTLEPARETSGDFYDFIPLPDRRWGIIIADVADKGAGAALYMALTRTLIRTYAREFVKEPQQLLQTVNERILADTHTGMFVTLFYGVLDPGAGAMTFCNAGHHPPLLFRAGTANRVRTVGRSGLPLGIVEDGAWERGTVQIAPGDVLLLYTDGVTEAQAAEGLMFGEERLLEAAQARLHSWETSAQAIQTDLLAEIHEFVGDAPQFDDLTLMVIVRNAPGERTGEPSREDQDRSPAK